MASPEDASVQTVKLKVLYTFDVDSKDNHLARWPQSLQVNTCFVDNANQIGVVDLRTCLEAVTTASPELVSQLELDYAIYAYDYSEEDTPLVGQGLLSKNMGDAGMELENEAMITGRITKGLMGLLNKNSQPTLEVKLRLKPVASSMQRQRSGSISSQDGRPAWLQNPEATIQRSASPMDTTGFENMQRMLSEGGPTRDRPDTYAHSRPGSRAGTPGAQQQYDTLQRPTMEDYSRPNSRTGIRQPPHARRDSYSGYYSGEEVIDDGPARKRAKITKVGTPSKGTFNIEQQPDDLRTMAGKASSVRIHRPTPMHPSGLPANLFANEEPVRPPTPVPSAKTGQSRGRPRLTAARLSTVPPSRGLAAAQAALPKPENSESAIMSPEEQRARSASSTPANIPSSPPVMPQPLPARTSPTLPPMHNESIDSGFGSGNLDDDIFGGNGLVEFHEFDFNKAGDVNLELDFGHFDEKHFAPVFEENNETVAVQQMHHNESQHEASYGQGPPAPQAFLPPPARPLERSQSFTPVGRPQPSMSSPKLAPAPFPRARQITEEQQKALPKPAKRELPPIPASDPGTRKLERAQTWAPDSDAVMSEAPTGSDGTQNAKARSKKKVGKAQTKARLEKAIASGEIPPYCDNCGSIETPAWRRGYAKLFDCPYDDIETGLGPGDVVYKHPVEQNKDGTVKTFRGFKTDRRPEDEANGWEQIVLCNPCGLWFHKQKCPRPKEKWQKAPRGKRRRNAKGSKATKKPGQPNPRSDAPTPASDDSSPADTDAPDYDNDEYMQDINGGDDETTDSNEPQLPLISRGMRASSADPPAQGLRRATIAAQQQRRVQSSPMKGGNSEADPIEVDLTPKPLRRQLFPSPDKVSGAPGSGSGPSPPKSGGLLPSFVRRSPRLTKTKDVFQIPGVAGVVALTADGKENVLPELDMEHSLMSIDDLFNYDGNEPMLPPSTPMRRSERLLSKTPQRGFGAEVSSNVQRSPTFRTPKPKQAQHPVTAALLGTAIKDMTNLTPFTRSIQEALNGPFTPGKDKSSRRSTPRKTVGFDFPDLPSLNGSSPSSNDAIFNINFSELPTDIQTDMSMFSTDAAMPSSPPNFSNFLHSDGHGDQGIDSWNNGDIEHLEKSAYPDPSEMGLAPTGTPRRSPRNSK